MTMADNHHIANGPSSQIPMGKMSPQMRVSNSNVNEESCTVDASPLHNDPKKRKRKRLLAVLDKLHNNNNNNTNNDTTNTNLASVAAAAAMAAAINAAAAAAAAAHNENNNSILVNNNHILSAMSSASPSASSTTSSHSSSHELMSKMSTSPSPSSMFSTNSIARSMHDNAEILRNLFALSRSLPSAASPSSPLAHHPAFPSPFALSSSPSPNYVAECNNNNNNHHSSENNFTPSPDQIKMMLLNNGKVVKTEVKEEMIDEEEANCSASVRDSKTPLHEFLQLPKTAATSSSNAPHMMMLSTSSSYGSSDGHPAQLSPYHTNNSSSGKHFYFDQEMPLDLSMSTMKRRQSSSSSSAGSPSLTKQLLMQQTEQKFNAVFNPLGIQVPRDCSLSLQTTPNSDSISPNLPQYYQDLKVSPIVEDVAPGKNSIGYVCPICGQMFSLNDRLAKHIASRHKTKSPASETTKSYVCEVCDRSFAR